MRTPKAEKKGYCGRIYNVVSTVGGSGGTALAGNVLVGGLIGASINEFSTDVTLSQNSNEKVPTQAAVKAYVDNSFVTNRPFTYWVATS